MNKIILINPPPIRETPPAESSSVAERYFLLRDVKSPQHGDQQCEPNGGLLALGASLEQAGFEVEIHDFNICYCANRSAFDGSIAWQTIERLLRKSVESAFAVGISSITLNAKVALNLAAVVKTWNECSHVTLGGIFPTLNPGFFLKDSSVDSVLLGLGHDTYPRLLASLTAKLTPPRNVLFRKDFDPSRPISRAVPPMPTSIPPFPAFHLLQEYCRPSVFRLLSAYGCRFKCTFCSPARFSKHRVLTVDPKAFAAAVKSTLDEYPTNTYLIGDLTFFQEPEHSLATCEQLRQLNIPERAGYWCQIRPELLSTETTSALQASGCRQVAMGIESFRDTSVNRLAKVDVLKDLRKKLRLLQDHGIEAQIYLMVGIPGESMQDVVSTIEHSTALLDDGLLQHTNVGVFVPFKGLPKHRDVQILDDDPQNYAMAVYPDQWPLPVYQTSKLSREQIRSLWELSLASYLKYL